MSGATTANGAMVRTRYSATFVLAASGEIEKNNDPANAMAISASPAELNAWVRASRAKGSTWPEPRCSGRHPPDGAADRLTQCGPRSFAAVALTGTYSSRGRFMPKTRTRSLPPTGTLHAVEKRLSRQLGSRRWDESSLTEQYVAWVAPQKVIGYAIRKGIAALWAAGLLKRPSFGFG